MTVFDLEENSGVWFDLDGGGRVQLRTMTPIMFRTIQKQTTTKRVEYKRIEGKGERFEILETNDELQNELFWDYIIVAWEGTEKPCTRENKVRMMNQSPKFNAFVNACVAKLSEDGVKQAEAAEANLSPGPPGP